MARLKVRLRGKTINDLPLVGDRQYIAGRKDDCDIVLQAEQGISREHFRLYSDNGFWSVEVMSRYGDVSVNGEKVQNFNLDDGQIFVVAPYEFEFLKSAADPSALQEGASASAASSSNSDSGEKTVVGISVSVPYVKVLEVSGETKELFRLEGGDTWLAGRDDSCHILIRDQRVSRKQFEIRKVNSQFYIVDLGSVNGTLLNGSPVPTSEPAPIRSGDSINVLDNNLSFELHDPNFKNRMEMVNLQPLTPLVPLSQDPDQEQLIPFQQPSSLPIRYENSFPPALHQNHFPQPLATSVKQSFDFKKHRIKFIIGAVLLLSILYQFSTDSEPAAPAQSVAMDPFSKLKPEQQVLVKQSYQLAKNLYMQGKYELAQNEIAKIFELIPDYEDIKEIQRLAREAVFIQDQKRHQEEIEKAKVEVEEKILVKVAECEKRIHPAVTLEEIENCLSDVVQFNPDHPKISELKNIVGKITSDREAKAVARSVRREQVGKLRNMYTRAVSLQKSGKNLGAISAYRVVIASKLPDPDSLKKEAETNISNIRKMMTSRTAALQLAAEKFEQANNYRGAILSLRQARQIDPENDTLQDKINHLVLELRKQMMILYQEGILEESFGNVEGSESKTGAKDKWKKIIEQDIPDGEYYKKAYIKLKKYGTY